MIGGAAVYKVLCIHIPGGGGGGGVALPTNGLLGMCCSMGSHFMTRLTIVGLPFQAFLRYT